MRRQAAEFGAVVQCGSVTHVTRDDQLFRASSQGSETLSRTLLLATGVVNNKPRIDEADHAEALAKGLLRYCPICDGYEVIDKNIGVIGTGRHGSNEAKFLRMYSGAVTLISPDPNHELGEDERRDLEQLDIRLQDGPCGPLRIAGAQIIAPTAQGDLAFDVLYPALGSTIRSELAIGLGADASEDGCLVVDHHQRTSIPGLYAAGDVVKGLDQISHAMGEGGVAATTIRNDLAALRRLVR
jgi:thioredoxin reductase (NADPH)